MPEKETNIVVANSFWAVVSRKASEIETRAINHTSVEGQVSDTRQNMTLFRANFEAMG